MPAILPTTISQPMRAAYSSATSRAAQRAYIQTILGSILAILLLGVACFGYILFYYNYIPQIGLETTVHLIYGQTIINSPHFALTTPRLKGAKLVPHGGADISKGVLMHNQPYDVYVSLTLPTSPHNIEAGNFMINLTLFDENLETPGVLATSRRSACLTYRSDIINTMDTVMRSPLYLSGWRKEQEKIDVLMMEGEVFTKKRLPSYLGIRVGNDYASDKAPEAYECKILFKARFRGLRYFMYNYRIIAFITFTSAFWVTELFWAAITWAFVSSYWLASDDENADDDEDPLMEKPTQSSETERRMIHPLAPVEDDSAEDIPRPRGGVYATPEATPAPEGEEGDDEDSEDQSNDRSDEGGRTPTSIDENTLQGSAQDSGIGTSMSEQRGEGLVRRRSGRRNE
ncbi:Seipin family [Arthrobotrys flagrans]|uniref:Seipin family n=1 Tax=Arthrobotrys flagrans TaxID=97331 RepID=A0A437A576_ARTFL|nr:Seipin family [Arthrobotrys flagrans]